MSKFRQYVLPIFGIAFGVGLFVVLMWLEVIYVLPSRISLPVDWNESVSDWVMGFRIAEQEWILIPTIVLAFIWFCVCWTKPSYEGDNRPIWFVLWILDAAVALVCIFLAKLEINVGILPELFTLVNALLIFWLSTALFSPISHKFAPLGSSLTRKLW